MLNITTDIRNVSAKLGFERPHAQHPGVENRVGRRPSEGFGPGSIRADFRHPRLEEAAPSADAVLSGGSPERSNARHQ